MEKLKFIIIFFIISNKLLFGQSIMDIDSETILDIGNGAEVCADQQTGNGILTGEGYFCGVTLPVELISFTFAVNERDVTLNWTTSNETNNSGFDIEKSVVKNQLSAEWIKTGFVKGSGTVNGQQHYFFKDNNLLPGKYKYRLKQIDFNGNTEYFNLAGEINIGAPQRYYLSQNYPNPFNPSTTIDYEIPSDGNVKLIIYNTTGKQIEVLVNSFQTKGFYKVKFNFSQAEMELTSGVYFYKLIVSGNDKFNATEFSAVKKMFLVK